MSRKREPFPACVHIEEAFKQLLTDHPSLTFDGELYNHEYRDNFEGLMSVIRKKKPTAEHLAEAGDKVQLHVYDMYDSENPDDVTEQRLSKCRALLIEYGLINGESPDGTVLVDSPIVFTDTTISNIEHTLVDHVDGLVESLRIKDELAGYEGTMIRFPDATYEVDKRSKRLLKVKEMIDEEFVIVAVNEGNGKWAGAAKSCTFIHPESGKEFKAGIKGTLEDALHIWTNRHEYVGKQGTVQFQELTKYGVPRFGIVVKFWLEDKV